jgi:hypothetical protein
VTLAILHFARWLAWQLSEPEHQPGPARPASITVFTGLNPS